MCIYFNYYPNLIEEWCDFDIDLSECGEKCPHYYEEDDFEADIADYMNEYERDLVEIF